MDSNKKVLIIDDEVDTCLLLSTYFSKKGYEVSCSYSLTDGLQQLDEMQPDIIFMDNNLPDGFGWELTSYIMDRMPAVELHLISAYNNSSYNYNRNKHKIKMWQKPISFRKLDELMKKKMVF